MDGAGLYHERQCWELCAVHALNNLLQRPQFSKQSADSICTDLSPQSVLNPHRSVLGTGNYDVNVIMAALLSQGLRAVWWDRRRSLQCLCVSRPVGFILNVPSRVSLGLLSLPLRRRHWVAVRRINGPYYNLDSKLKSPVCIGGEEELRLFLGEQLSLDSDSQLLLVVSEEVEEEGSWLLTADGPHVA
ncbi:josephin-2 [Amia ocellicauda]|uniref:josephin-2 n=1 Tax=Amia ocellicauda TaxID=2972642 RepID=UPI003464CC79